MQGSSANGGSPGHRFDSADEVVYQDILDALKGLQFGEVTITVREGRIIQIERVARRRQIVNKRAE